MDEKRSYNKYGSFQFQNMIHIKKQIVNRLEISPDYQATRFCQTCHWRHAKTRGSVFGRSRAKICSFVYGSIN
jgi:hypothetical protein